MVICGLGPGPGPRGQAGTIGLPGRLVGQDARIFTRARRMLPRRRTGQRGGGLGRCPARSGPGDPHGARLVARLAAGRGRPRIGRREADRDLQAVGGKPFGQALPPFHHRHRAGQVQVEVVHLGQPAEPVGVHVHQGRAVGQRRVYPGDDERRRGDRAAYPQGLAQALYQGGLARAERPGQQHQVPGVQQPGQAAPEPAHRGGGRHGDGRRRRFVRQPRARLPRRRAAATAAGYRAESRRAGW